MNIITRLIRHELISGSFYIFLGSMLTNVLAFLLNLYLARNLTYADYAIFASLLSIIILVSIPAGTINTVIVKFATDYHAKNQIDKVKLLYVKFFKFILLLSIFTVFIFTIIAIPLKEYLHVDNVWYIIVTGFVIAAGYLNVLHSAFLQSLLKFKFLSFLGIVAGVVKLLFGVLMVYLGFRAFGGVWAIFFMTAISFLIAYFPLRRIILLKVKNKDIPIKTTEIYSYAVPAFIAALSLTAFTSMDVILVKHFFSSHQAGFYAGLSLIGRVIFYFTIPIPVVMFPLLVKRHSTGKSFINIFYLSLILVALPSLAITAFYALFPEFVIKLFLGGRDYLVLSGYLGIFGLFLTVFSMVNVCVNFFLSLGKTKIAYLVVVASIFQIILIYLFHNNFYQVITVSLITLTILLFTLLIIFFKFYGNIAKIKETAAFLNTPTI